MHPKLYNFKQKTYEYVTIIAAVGDNAMQGKDNKLPMAP
jgi:hypothetical protein